VGHRLAGGRLRGAGWTEVDAFRGAFGVFLATSVLSYGWFLWSSGHNRKHPMNAILLIAHAPLANALRQCALHVFPECGPT
jgi:hypothetical protein